MSSLEHVNMLDRVASKFKSKDAKQANPIQHESSALPAYGSIEGADAPPPAYSKHDNADGNTTEVTTGDNTRASFARRGSSVQYDTTRSASLTDSTSRAASMSKGKKIEVGQRWGKTPAEPYRSRNVDEVPADHPVHQISLERQEEMRKKGINPVLRAEMDQRFKGRGGFWAKYAGCPGDGGWVGVN